MTQAEYAAHRNCGLRTVRRAVAAGAVPVTRPGPLGRILVDEADRRWAPGDTKSERPTTAGRRGARSAARVRREREGADPDDETQDRDPDAIVGEDLDDELLRAQIRERRAKAELARDQLERDRKNLIPRAEVVADATRAATEIRTRLRSLGASVALRLECGCRRAAEVQALVDQEVNEILTVLNRTRFAPREDAP